MSCFKDDSMHAWDSSDLKYKYQIPPPFGPTPHYRAFAVPQDGRVLVGGGRSNFLHIWTMENRQLLRIVQLPSAIRHVKQLVFFPDSFDGGTSEVYDIHVRLWVDSVHVSYVIDIRFSWSRWGYAFYQHSLL